MAAHRTRLLVLLLPLVAFATSGCTKTRGGGGGGGDLAAAGMFGVVGLLMTPGTPDEPRDLSPCERARATWRKAHRSASDRPPDHLRCGPGGEWPEGAEKFVSADVYTGIENSTLPPVVSEGDPGPSTEVLTATCGGTDTQIEHCEEERARRRVLEQKDR